MAIAKITFHVSGIVKEKIEQFEKDHGCTSPRPKGGNILGTRFKYTFFPTNGGTLATVQCLWCKKEYTSDLIETGTDF